MKNALGPVCISIGCVAGLLLGALLASQVDPTSFLRWSPLWPRYKWPSLLEALCALLGTVAGLLLALALGWRPEQDDAGNAQTRSPKDRQELKKEGHREQ